MKRIYQLLSATGLLLTVLPAVLVFTGSIEWSTHASLMIVGTILWFLTAPAWLNREDSARA